MMQPPHQRKNKSGSLYAIGAYTTWGFVPLFWKELSHVPPMQILAHRIIWSVSFFVLLFQFRGSLQNWIRFAFQKKTIKKSLPSALAIGINWGLYIFAVNSGHAIEASLGYFINPILNVIIGATFFEEKLNNYQWSAFLSACIGVIYLTLSAGTPPWIALSLAGTFASYGVIRKKTELKGTSGTALESALLLPVATLILFSPQFSPISLWSIEGNLQPIKTIFLLTVGGALTALPLVWFAEAAQRLPLSVLGFYQYLSPTFQFLIALFIFKEKFDFQKLIAFIFIWFGLAIFIIDSARRFKKTNV